MPSADMAPRRPAAAPAGQAAPAAGPGASAQVLASAPGLRWRRRFPGAQEQLREVRRWLDTLLPDCPGRDDVSCVATELGTNAVRHTASGRGGSFTVDITWHPSFVRILVADGGAPHGPRRPGAGHHGARGAGLDGFFRDEAAHDGAGDADDEHGRGLLLVEGLAACTGVSGDHRGRQVWAEVPWTAPVTPRDRYEAAIQAGHASLAGAAGAAPAWFGRATRQYWALARGRLVAAATAHDLAGELGPVLNSPRLGGSATGSGLTCGGGTGGRAGGQALPPAAAPAA